MIKLLHVDDNAADLELIGIHIRRLCRDLELVQTQDPRQALEMAADDGLSCIVSDFQMPGMNGLELLAELRNRNIFLPFILLTGQGSEAIAAEALRSGADDYFTKEAGFAHYQRFMHSIQRVIETNALKREQERALSALRESEERFRIAFRTSPDSININRLKDGLYIDINDGFTATTGYSREDVIGRTSLETNIWADPADRQRLVEGLKRDGHVENLEARFRMKDGRVLTGLMSARVIMLEGESHILSVTRNIESRIRGEEETRQSGEHFRSLFENAPLPYQSLDENGAVTEINSAWLELFGYQRDEVVGHSLGEFVDPPEVPRLMEHFRQFKAAGLSRGSVFHFRDKSGDTHLMEIEGRVGWNPDGSFLRIHCILTDIGEREKKRRELGLFRFLLEHGPDPVIITGTDGHIIMANAAAADVLGYSAGELIGFEAGLIELNTRHRAWPEIWERVRQDREERLITRFKRKDGTFFPVEVHLSLLEYEGQECVCAFCRDISVLVDRERQITEAGWQVERARAEVGRQRQFLDMMLNASPNFIFVKDVQRRYVLTNDTFAALHGHTPAEMVGFSDDDLDPMGMDLSLIREHDESILKGEREIARYDLQIVTKDGTKRWYHVIKRPMFNTEGAIEHLFGVALEISDRKEIEEELRRRQEELESTGRLLAATNRELESFAYTVSHDLRAPLRRISQFASLLRDGLPKDIDPDAGEYMQRIKANCGAMQELIEALLTLSQHARGEIRREEIDLSALVRGILTELRQGDPQRQVTAVIENDLHASADARLIGVVMRNLLENAWKFTQKKKKARIEFSVMRGEDGRTSYRVSDNGVGFRQDDAARIFTVFQRLHTDEQFSGSGIGLATVQRIIHRHGGDIWAEGEEGKGATFYFTL